MGGYFSKAPYWMGFGGWLAGGFAGYLLVTDKALRQGNPGLNKIWILWAGFLIYVGISLLNPAYKQIEVPRGLTYMQADPVAWLPSVVALPVSAPMVLQLTGSIMLAWSLLAVVRRRSAVRALLVGLVVNAFILALVGAYFKVTGAKDILNYFASVNPKFFASFTYHNHWVAYAGFHLFLATGLLVHYRHPHQRLDPELSRRPSTSTNLVGFLWVCCFFLFLSLFLVESRAGLLVAFLYLGFLAVFSVRNQLSRYFRNLKRSVATIVVLALLGFVSYQIVLPQLGNTTGRIQQSWDDFWTEDKEVDNFRFNIGPKITADLIEERPILGWGWGSYPFAMSIFAPEYLDNQMAQFAHNDWLQFISELGILGLLLFSFPMVHLSAYFRPDDHLARFSRYGILLLLLIAFFEGPFTNPVVLATVLLVTCSDLSVRRVE